MSSIKKPASGGDVAATATTAGLLSGGLNTTVTSGLTWAGVTAAPVYTINYVRHGRWVIGKLKAANVASTAGNIVSATTFPGTICPAVGATFQTMVRIASGNEQFSYGWITSAGLLGFDGSGTGGAFTSNYSSPANGANYSIFMWVMD